MKMIRVHKVNILRLFNAVSFLGHQTLISKAGSIFYAHGLLILKQFRIIVLGGTNERR